MRKRSSSYPGKNLQDVEKFCISVFEKVGDTVLKYADLAKHGGVPVREVDTFASTATQYGWMTAVRGKGFSANSAICRALRTPKDGEKNAIYLTAFQSPVIYKWLINHVNGKLVTEEGLRIDLVRDKDFSDPGSKQATKIFLENAKFLGLIDADNNFNAGAEIVINPEVIKETKTKSQSGSSPSTTKKANIQEKHKSPIQHTPLHDSNSNAGSMKKLSLYVRGQELTFSVFENMTQADWDAVIKQIQNIKAFSK